MRSWTDSVMRVEVYALGMTRSWQQQKNTLPNARTGTG